MCSSPITIAPTIWSLRCMPLQLAAHIQRPAFFSFFILFFFFAVLAGYAGGLQCALDGVQPALSPNPSDLSNANAKAFGGEWKGLAVLRIRLHFIWQILIVAFVCALHFMSRFSFLVSCFWFPFQIKVGNVYPMTLAMFQSLLNASYSYFTMLRGVTNK